MATIETTPVVVTDAATGPLPILSSREMLKYLTLAATGGRATVTVELVRGGVAYPLVHKRSIEGNQDTRLRIPPVRPEAGDLLRVSSDAPVTWRAAIETVPAGINTSLILTRTSGGTNTVIFNSGSNTRWRVVSTLGCCLTGGGASASLLRYTLAGNKTDLLVPPYRMEGYESIRATPVIVLEPSQSLRANTRGAVQWFTFGVREQ